MTTATKGAGSGASEKKKRTPGRSSRSILLPDDLIARAKGAVFWTRMFPDGAPSFAALAERAITKEVEELERRFNDGEHFPEEALTPGPAAGVMERVWQERRRRTGTASAQEAGDAASASPGASTGGDRA